MIIVGHSSIPVVTQPGSLNIKLFAITVLLTTIIGKFLYDTFIDETRKKETY
jgi:hypothetical protein